MSEIVTLNRSFSDNKINSSTLSIEDERVVVSYNKNGKEAYKEAKIKDIIRIDVLNSRCPAPFKRNIWICIELIGVLCFILGIIFRNREALLATFAVIGLLCVVGSAVGSKMLFNRSPDAVEVSIITKDNKIYALGCRTTSKDYNSMIRLAKECKKMNKGILLNMQTKK